MKGVVFTEFQEMIEDQFGLEMYDRLIQACELSSRARTRLSVLTTTPSLLQLVTKLELGDWSGGARVGSRIWCASIF